MVIVVCHVLYAQDIGQMEQADALAVPITVIIQNLARFIIVASIRNLIIAEIVKVFLVYG